MNKTAVIDIDNTLWQFCDAFSRELRKINPAFPPIEQWTTWNFFEGFCTEAEFMAAVDAVHRRQDSDEYQPYPEAKGFLRTLKDQGYRVVIASHRRQEMQGPTEQWLRKHELPYDELHLSFDKTVLFEDAAVVVDDAPHTLEKAVACKAIGAGLLFPWNKAYAGNGFGLFGNLNEVMAYILQKQKINPA
jgi:5' nucleotidase, deoxy (Pyrimidine), cytosolic type C protein (NT5C)